MDPKTRKGKNESVEKRCAEVVKGNTKRVKKWIVEALEEVKKQNNSYLIELGLVYLKNYLNYYI